VISPLLANVYLHYVLDVWWQEAVEPRLAAEHPDPLRGRLRGGVTDEADARRAMEVLPKRFGKYGLAIHPDKTRLVPFARPQGQKGREETGVGQPTTWDVRLPGVHPLLGEVEEEQRGSQETDGSSRIRRFAKAIGNGVGETDTDRSRNSTRR